MQRVPSPRRGLGDRGLMRVWGLAHLRAVHIPRSSSLAPITHHSSSLALQLARSAHQAHTLPSRPCEPPRCTCVSTQSWNEKTVMSLGLLSGGSATLWASGARSENPELPPGFLPSEHIGVSPKRDDGQSRISSRNRPRHHKSKDKRIENDPHLRTSKGDLRIFSL